MSPLSEQENERIFKEDILRSKAKDLCPSKAVIPTLLFVAGQSAAGKSSAIETAAKEMKAGHGQALLIQRDALREYVPGYNEAIQGGGLDAYKGSKVKIAHPNPAE